MFFSSMILAWRVTRVCSPKKGVGDAWNPVAWGKILLEVLNVLRFVLKL